MSNDLNRPELQFSTDLLSTPAPHPLDFVYLRMICSYQMVPYVQNLHHIIIELVSPSPLTDNEHDTVATYGTGMDSLLKACLLISSLPAYQKGHSECQAEANCLNYIYANMLLRLKALLQQSTSVSLTTDAAKMPTGDSYVAVTCQWISMD